MATLPDILSLALCLIVLVLIVRVSLKLLLWLVGAAAVFFVVAWLAGYSPEQALALLGL